MSKRCKLSTVARYRNDRIDTARISTKNYISTANMMSARRGITEANGLPPTTSVLKYRTNDVLISNIRPYYKKIWLAQFDGGCSGDILVLNAKESKLHPKYLYYLLSQDRFFAHMMAGAKGAKMPRGNKAAILDFEFCLPSLSVQHQIAERLSPYDRFIENNTARIRLLEEAVHLLYKEWFVYFRFPNHQHGTMRHDLPRDWSRTNVGAILAPSPKMNKIQKMEYLDDGTHPIIDQGIDRIGGYTNNGDLVNDLGHAVVVFGDHTRRLKFIDEPFVCGADGTRVLYPKDSVSVEYLYCALSHLKLPTQGYARHFKYLQSATIVLPSNKTMKQFTDVVRSHLQQIRTLHQTNQTLRRTRESLLPKLMRGTTWTTPR